MATVNKQSLREEFDALTGEFERLCASGKMAADSRALFQAMLMLFEVLMVVVMEKRTPKNSANSSNPSSQTPKDDTATTQAPTPRGISTTVSAAATPARLRPFKRPPSPHAKPVAKT